MSNPKGGFKKHDGPRRSNNNNNNNNNSNNNNNNYNDKKSSGDRERRSYPDPVLVGALSLVEQIDSTFARLFLFFFFFFLSFLCLFDHSWLDLLETGETFSFACFRFVAWSFESGCAAQQYVVTFICGVSCWWCIRTLRPSRFEASFRFWLPSFFPEKVVVVLRDHHKATPKTIIGILRSFDTYGECFFPLRFLLISLHLFSANVVLEDAFERIYVNDVYGDVKIDGWFIVRAENVILVGELDGEEKDVAKFKRIDEAKIKELQKVEIEKERARRKVIAEVMDDINHEEF
jgi:small nuclear ribonucleoprotein (snRNP)-like protein